MKVETPSEFFKPHSKYLCYGLALVNQLVWRLLTWSIDDSYHQTHLPVPTFETDSGIHGNAFA